MSMIGNYISVEPKDVEKLQANEEYVEDLLEQFDHFDQTMALSIEKSWQAIHYILNGDPWQGTGPLGNTVLGGREIGEDLGYGPARFLTPEQVKETSKALDALTPEQFTERLRDADFEANDIYVFSGEDPNDPDVIEELVGYYGEIRTFFKNSAGKNHGIVLYLG